jgi:hypothetical protein
MGYNLVSMEGASGGPVHVEHRQLGMMISGQVFYLL